MKRINPLSVCLLVFVPGCNPGGAAVQTTALAPQSIQQQKSSEASSVSDPRVVKLGHDFGLVRPGETMSHRYKITNDTDREWKLTSIKNSCSCTATRPDFTSILPRLSAEVVVNYRAAPDNRDDHKSVQLVFAEVGSPIVVLDIRARIRHEVSAIPASIEFGSTSGRSQRERVLEIQNFSDRDWESLKLVNVPTWLDGKLEELPSTLVDDRPQPVKMARQRWRLVLVTKCDQLAHGRHAGNVQVVTTGERELSQVIPVSVQLDAPLTAIPAQFFFGQMGVGKTVSRSIVIRLSEEVTNWSESDLQLESSLGEALQLVAKKTDQRTCELTATFEAQGDPGIVEGNVRVRLLAPVDASISIPVLGSIR